MNKLQLNKNSFLMRLVTFIVIAGMLCQNVVWANIEIDLSKIHTLGVNTGLSDSHPRNNYLWIEMAVAQIEEMVKRQRPSHLIREEVKRIAEEIGKRFHTEEFTSNENWAYAIESMKKLASIDAIAVREGLSYKFPDPKYSIDDYRRKLVEVLGEEGDRVIDELIAYAEALKAQGKTKIVVLNATFAGGGVAMMMETMGQILQQLGIEVEWHIIYPKTAEFYDITKTIHNTIRGRDTVITDEQLELWDSVNRDNFEILGSIFHDSDIASVFIEDPQVMPLIKYAKESGSDKRLIWRLHIDISGINKGNTWAMCLWEKMSGYIGHLTKNDAVLFQPYHVPDVLGDCPASVFEQPAGIDVIRETNQSLGDNEVEGLIEEINEELLVAGPKIDTKRPAIVTGARYDYWKGIPIVLNTFEQIAHKYPDLDLIIFGNYASDDPEGVEHFNLLKNMVENSKFRERIHLVANTKGKRVSALYRLAAKHHMPYIALSLREGYNLMTDEASVQEAAIMTSNIGGLQRYTDSVDGLVVNIRTIVDRVENASKLYEWQDEGLLVSQHGGEMESELFGRLDSILSVRQDDKPQYERTYRTLASGAKKLSFNNSLLSMLKNYLGLSATESFGPDEDSSGGMSRRSLLKGGSAAGAFGLGYFYSGGLERDVASGFIKAARAEPKERVTPSKVEIAEDNGDYRFVINGQKTDGVPGMVYQHIPESKKHLRIEQFFGRYGYSAFYKGLLDKEEGGEGHAKILSDMGVKAIRIYALSSENTRDIRNAKRIFRRIYEQYGIMVMVGNYTGLYDHARSRARDKEAIKRDVRKMVRSYGREPWLLSWQLGNENDFYLKDIGRFARSLRVPIHMTRREYYKFMDELAGLVKDTEGAMGISHPVILGHGDPEHNEDIYSLIVGMKNIDAVGLNVYRHAYDLKDLFRRFKKLSLEAKRKFPIIISEFGSTVYRDPKLDIPKEQAEQEQLAYNRNIWRVVRDNTAGRGGYGNVLGGFCFTFTDQLFNLHNNNYVDAYYGVLGRPSQDMFTIPRPETIIIQSNESSEELLTKAFKALETQQLDVAIHAAGIIIKRHEKQARIEQRDKDRRIRGGENFKYTAGDEEVKEKVHSFGSLNLTGAALLIMGKAYQGKKKYKEARKYYNKLIKEFSLAEVWSDGDFFWKPVEEAKKELPIVKLSLPLVIEGIRRASGDDEGPLRFNIRMLADGFRTKWEDKDVHVRGVYHEERKIRNYVSALRCRTARGRGVVAKVHRVYVPRAEIDYEQTATTGEIVLKKIPVERSSLFSILPLLEADGEGLLEFVELHTLEDYRQAAIDLNIDPESFINNMVQVTNKFVFVSDWVGPSVEEFIEANLDDEDKLIRVAALLGETLGVLHSNGLIAGDTHLNQFVVRGDAEDVVRIDLVNVYSTDEVSADNIFVEFMEVFNRLRRYSKPATSAFVRAHEDALEAGRVSREHGVSEEEIEALNSSV